MSRETQKTLQTANQGKPSSRRDLLTGVGALIGLGASVLIQPNGGVAYAKEGGSKAGVTAIKSTGPTAPKNPPIKADASKKKNTNIGGKKKEVTPKKEGG